ncbi:unnamed protein product [Ascophyllum nodosum]
MEFVVPCALLGSIALDLAVCFLWTMSAVNIAETSFDLEMTDVVIATCLRLPLAAVFAALYYRGRRIRLRFPVLWEAVNVSLVGAKCITFMLKGVPFKEAWFLLGLCSASIGLEMVLVAHLRSSAGMLRVPSQHVFLPAAVGAMATMNLTKNPSAASLDVPQGEWIPTGYSGDQTDLENGLLHEEEEKRDRVLTRKSSFHERMRFLSNWNHKVEELREKWGSKVEELREKMRHRSWGAGEGGGVMAGADKEKTPLLLLARMYMQDQSAIEELQDFWTLHPKWTEFFLPQYTLFLLYASFVHCYRLEELLLDRCELSVHVAHSIFWFLKAFCVEGAGVTPIGVQAINEFLGKVVLNGERPAQAFCEKGWGRDGGKAIRCMELFDAPKEEGGFSTSFGGRFGEAPAFVHELVKIAVELGAVERRHRTNELRKKLRKVQARFLPSRAIYLPVGRRGHRVYRIVLEESFSFSTKDRAPYLVTLEVMDFPLRQAATEVHALAGEGRRDGAGQSPTTGGQKLARMLTPRSLRLSLRGIGRTITTLKRGVPQESFEPGQQLGDVEDPLPTERSIVPSYEQPRTSVAAIMGMWSRPSKPNDAPPESAEAPSRSVPLASSNSSNGDEQMAVAGVPMSMDDTGASAGREEEKEDRTGLGTAAAKSVSPGSRSVGIGAERADTLLLSRDGNVGSARRAGYGAADPLVGIHHDTDTETDEDEDEDEDAGSAPTVIFKELWRRKESRFKRASSLGKVAKGWRLMPVIVKAGDDLRQEQIAAQFFFLANSILQQSSLGNRAGLRPYDIVATLPDAGMIEAIPDTVSLDALKKNDPLFTTLLDFFHRHFGPPESEGFLRARRNFMESLAANCIVTYLLQVKDRHNGNILLDAKGRVIHIDFGFMLANSPGGNMKFESAPFKLTAEFVELMGGPSSECFKGFREVCVRTFMTLRRRMPMLILLIETSSVGNAHLPCFGGKPKPVVDKLRARFVPEVHDRAAMAHVNLLVDRSMKSWRTYGYDLYQNYAVGIAI